MPYLFFSKLYIPYRGTYIGSLVSKLPNICRYFYATFCYELNFCKCVIFAFIFVFSTANSEVKHILHPILPIRKNWIGKKSIGIGGSPGIVVMGGDSCSEGHGLESQHHILDGHFSHLFVVKK